VDALVFTGGIGEQSAEIREDVGTRVRCLGFEVINESVNGNLGEGTIVDLSLNGSKGKRVLVCRTDEQFEMARQCVLEEKFWKKTS